MTWQDIVLPLAHWPPTHQSCAALAMLPQVSLYVESPIRPRFIFQWHLQKNKHSLFTIGALRSAYVTSPVLWEVWFQMVPKTCVAITIPGIWWHISSGTQGHYKLGALPKRKTGKWWNCFGPSWSFCNSPSKKVNNGIGNWVSAPPPLFADKIPTFSDF